MARWSSSAPSRWSDEQGKTRRYRTLARHFEETVNWFVAYGSTEVWSVLNLTEDTHPFHVHLVQFRVLSRDLYNKDGFHPETGGTTAPISFQGYGELDAKEPLSNDKDRSQEILHDSFAFKGDCCGNKHGASPVVGFLPPVVRLLLG